MIAGLTLEGPVRTNTLMAFLAHILQLFRVTAAFAVIFALGFSLPSAAHAIAGHHGNAAVSHTGANDSGAAMHGGGHHTSQTAAHHGQEKSETSEIGSCCSGSCIADAVLTFVAGKTFLAEPVRWKQKNAQLPSLEQITLLRPPKA